MKEQLNGVFLLFGIKPITEGIDILLSLEERNPQYTPIERRRAGRYYDNSIPQKIKFIGYVLETDQSTKQYGFIIKLNPNIKSVLDYLRLRNVKSLYPEIIEDFYQERILRKEPLKSDFRTEFYRDRLVNEHKKWVIDEDKKLLALYKLNTPLKQICGELQRTPEAIRYRLEFLLKYYRLDEDIDEYMVRINKLGEGRC